MPIPLFVLPKVKLSAFSASCFWGGKLYARSFPAVCMHSLLMTAIVTYKLSLFN